MVVDNYPADREELITLPNHPQHPEAGTRTVPFTRELYIDEDDFAEVPPPKFFRLKPEGEVRLMGGYIIKCGEIEKDPDGSVKLIHVTADLETGNGNPADGRKIKGTIHWLSAKYALPTTLMLYDRLFTIENTAEVPEGKTYMDYLNPQSLTKIEGAMVEPSLAQAKAMGYAPTFFGVDGMDGILTMEGFDTSLAEGVMVLTPFSADAQDEKTQSFVAEYKARHGETPNQFAADGYDCVYALKAALESAGCTPDMSAEEICEALVAQFPTMSFDGITGTGMTWGSNGEVSKLPMAVVIQDGVYVSA